MKFITCRTRGCRISIEEDFHVLETLYLLVSRHTHDAFAQLLMRTRERERERFAASRNTSIIRSKSSMMFYRSSKWTLSLFSFSNIFFSVDLLGYVIFIFAITIEFWFYIYIYIFPAVYRYRLSLFLLILYHFVFLDFSHDMHFRYFESQSIGRRKKLLTLRKYLFVFRSLLSSDYRSETRLTFGDTFYSFTLQIHAFIHTHKAYNHTRNLSKFLT